MNFARNVGLCSRVCAAELARGVQYQQLDRVQQGAAAQGLVVHGPGPERRRQVATDQGQAATDRRRTNAGEVYRVTSRADRQATQSHTELCLMEMRDSWLHGSTSRQDDENSLIIYCISSIIA